MTRVQKLARIAVISAILKTDDIAIRIRKDGDLHIANVKRFFNKIVDKSHPLRDAVKAVVFGVIYGKGARTLGNDTKKAEIDELRKRQNALYKEKRALEDVLRKAA